MEGVAGVVARVMPGRAPHDRELIALNAYWCRSVPQRVAENARPARLRRGDLTIHTRSPAWANTLQLEGESLLRALRSRFPQCVVTRLIFRVGPLPDLPLPPRPPPKPVHVVPLRDLPETVARELAFIQNDDVREAVRHAASVGLADSPSRKPQ